MVSAGFYQNDVITEKLLKMAVKIMKNINNFEDKYIGNGLFPCISSRIWRSLIKWNFEKEKQKL